MKFLLYEIDGGVTRFIDSYSASLEARVNEDAELKSRFCPNSIFQIWEESTNPLAGNAKLVHEYINGLKKF